MKHLKLFALIAGVAFSRAGSILPANTSQNLYDPEDPLATVYNVTCVILCGNTSANPLDERLFVWIAGTCDTCEPSYHNCCRLRGCDAECPGLTG